MTSDAEQYRPFSERNGLVPAAPQLEIGVISDDLRRRLDYAIDQEVVLNTDKNRPWRRKIYKFLQ